jgi:glyceraldehyde 3-phosphate dehydrogenase
VNPSIENIAYLLNFDTTYGRLSSPFAVVNGELERSGNRIKVTSKTSPKDIPWKKYGVDVVVESTGVNEIQTLIGKLVRSGEIKKAVVTHSSQEVDKTIIFGVNELDYNSKKHSYVSSSICDANAVAPALSKINSEFGINSGSLLTLHPWLGYQNLVDGPCRSFAYPGHYEENFALGRASTEALMPKSTSCMHAVKDVLPNIPDFMSMSYRVPTPVVSTAVLNINIKRSITKDEIISFFHEIETNQIVPVFKLNFDQLISKDFVGSKNSCIVDTRWIEIGSSGLDLRLVLWYDNEYGYSARVIDTVLLIGNG